MWSYWTRAPPRLDSRGAPRVLTLPPSPDLSYSHHGPHPSSSQASKAPPPDSEEEPLVDAEVEEEEKGEGSKPRYFQNPWPSYRTASLSDAMKAYQLGAAIAHPQPKEAGIPREDSMGLSDEGALADELPRLPRETWLPASTYVRPDFASMYEDDEDSDWRDPPVRVVKPGWGEERKSAVTWLGHAGALVQIPWKEGSGREGMCGVVFDPIFSYRCSPSQYVGPARYLDSPCSVAELPPVHVCCISHDHYDHLDYYTIMDLWKYHKITIHFFVPLGLKAWFEASKIPSERVTELDWWHESLLSFPVIWRDERDAEEDETDFEEDVEEDLRLKIAFTPAQHRSGRGVLDHMTTLWGSWCVGVVTSRDRPRARERGMRDWEGFKVYFGGDTGYRYATAPEGDPDAICPAFQEIADHYAPLTLSLLPLSTGSSLPFLRNLLMLSLDQYTLTSSLHCSPSDSLEIHRILKSERTVGIHWGTFCDASEARGTRVEFGRARRERGVSGVWDGISRFVDEDGEGEVEKVEEAKPGSEEAEEGKGRFVIAEIGETLVLP